MIKVGSKRSFDFAQHNPPCSPHKITSLDGISDHASKRRKVVPTSTQLNSTAVQEQTNTREYDLNSNFTVPNETLVEWLPKQKRVKFPPATEHEKFFSLAEVKYILAKALEQTTHTVSNEYEKVLQEKLQEQYNSFTQFNQDNIHRQLQSSTYDYMS